MKKASNDSERSEKGGGRGAERSDLVLFFLYPIMENRDRRTGHSEQDPDQPNVIDQGCNDTTVNDRPCCPCSSRFPPQHRLKEGDNDKKVSTRYRTELCGDLFISRKRSVFQSDQDEAELQLVIFLNGMWVKPMGQTHQ